MKIFFAALTLLIFVSFASASEKERKSRLNQSSEVLNDKLVFGALNIENETKPWSNSKVYELKYNLETVEPFTDENNILVIRDFKPDPRFTFHPEFSTRIAESNSFINFFPNFEQPKQINLKLVDLENQNVEVVIASKSGRVEFSKTIKVASDFSLISIDLDRTLNGKGIYEISIKTKDIWEGYTFGY